MIKKTWIGWGPAFMMLTVCVSSSEVPPIGNGRYMITGARAAA
jgi:hypothetical protein